MAAILGCGSEKEVQMNMSDVELVKIDTIQRYPISNENLLTWRSTDNVDYVTYVPLETYYTIGYKMKVMMRR